MDALFLRALQARQPQIRERWEKLLRAGLASSPLASPDVLVRLFDSTLADVFKLLAGRRPARRAADPGLAPLHAVCACGRNPLIAYFFTGERAALETLARLAPAQRARQRTAATELYLVFRQLARREIGAFCALCQYRFTGSSAKAPAAFGCFLPEPRVERMEVCGLVP